MMFRFKLLISIILVLELFGLPSPFLAQTKQTRKQIIVIDPGHGGKDSGAVGVNGILEKDVVLKIAKQIISLNQKIFGSKNEIYLTRNKDTLISLGDRTKIAKALKADIFISLHCNHSENPNARGLEVFVSKKKGKYTTESVLLAYGLQKRLRQNIGFESRGVKFGNFQVLRESINYFPSMLLELGFLSNKDERIYFKKNENYRYLGLSILKAIN